MAKVGRSARGEIIDFDMLAIQQALADAPAPVSVQARRDFIEEKTVSRVRPGMVTPGHIIETVENPEELIEDSEALIDYFKAEE